MADFKYVEPKCSICKKVINFSHLNRDCNLPHNYHAGCHIKLLKFLDTQRNPASKVVKAEVKEGESNEIPKDK